VEKKDRHRTKRSNSKKTRKMPSSPLVKIPSKHDKSIKNGSVKKKEKKRSVSAKMGEKKDMTTSDNALLVINKSLCVNSKKK